MDRQPQNKPLSTPSPHDRPWSARRCLLAAEDLASQVSAWHARGRLHAQVCLENIEVVGEHHLRLAPPRGSRIFGGDDCDLQMCPPELVTEAPIRLGEDLSSAAAALRRSGISLDPRRIDVYQMAAVLCQWLTGDSVQTYADSLRVKLQVPPFARAVLDRGLGFDSAERLQTCEDFAQALALALANQPEEDALAVRETPPEGNKPTGDTDLSDPGVVPSPAPSRPAKPLRLAHFQLLELIGRGGMGEVYRARDTKLDRVVAVKVLRQDLAGDESFIRRFQSEAHSLARLPHPNLLPMYFTGIDQGRRFFVMRYVDGQSLADQLRAHPRLELSRTLEIVAQCVSALAVAHDEGLIHRDIKPANVLLERATGQAYLVDFGLARRMDEGAGMTRTGVVMGTVEYLSPEQARGAKQIDHRADLYSLGVMLYQMLSGRLPFVADSAVGWIFQHVHEAPTPLETLSPELPPELCALVAELLAKRPEDRPADCRAVLDRLAPMLRCEPRAEQYAREARSLLDDEPVEEDATTFSDLPLSKDGVLLQWRDQAATLLRRNTPEWIRRLQSTDQQIDGVIARYQRRQRRLHALQTEGRHVQSLLQSQIAALTAHAEPTDVAMSRSNCEQELADLRAQEKELNEQSADIDLEAARVNTTLLRLVSQRDALRLRLRRLEPADNASTRRLWSRPFFLTLAGTLLLTAVIGWRQGLFVTPSKVQDPGLKGAPEDSGKSESPGDEQSPPVTPAPSVTEKGVDQQAAEAVLALGGKIKVDVNGHEFDVSQASQLPIVRYRVVEVNLDDAKGVRREHTEVFAQLASLHTLNLCRTHIDDDTFAPLSKLDRLTTLYCCSTRVTGDDLAKFAFMPSLRLICFSGPFEGRNLAHFVKFPNATHAYVNWTQVDDDSLAHLPPLTKLQVLLLDHCRISGPGLVHLKNVPNLQKLNLATTSLTDEGLWYLPTLPKLRELILDDNRIGDASIPHLARQTSLQQLKLNKTQFSKEGISLLRLKLPACAIEFTSDVPTKDDQALNDLTAEIAKTPQDAALLFKRGREQYARRRFAAAVNDFVAGLQIAPQDHSPRAHLAMSYLTLDDQDAFSKERDVLLKGLADAELPSNNRLQLLRTVTLLPLSATEMEHAKLQPADFAAYKDSAEGIQVALNYRSGNYPETIATADQHLKEHQSQLGTLYVKLWRAMALWQNGQRQEGKAALHEARKFATTCRGFSLAAPWSMSLYVQAIHREASRLMMETMEPLAIPILVTNDQRLAELNQKLVTNPNDGTLLVERAKLHRQWHRWDKSADDYEAYLALHVDNGWARIDAALMALAANRKERYFELCKESEALLLSDAPTGPKIFPLTAARNLSLLPGAVQRPEAVLAKAEVLAKADPKVWVLCVQVPLLYRLGRDEDVLKVGQQVLDESSSPGGSASAHLYRALALHRLGRIAQAKTELKKAQDLIKRFPPAGAKQYLSDEYVESLLLLPEVESVVK